MNTSVLDPVLEERDHDGLGAAELDALGTRVRVVAWPARRLAPILDAVRAELTMLDLQASRFRDDSELSRLRAAGAGTYMISRGLAEALQVAIAAARFTDGRVDPTIGDALVVLGYDRDFAEIGDEKITADPSSPAGDSPRPAPGFHTIELKGRLLRLPTALTIDLGATAKGLGADRCAAKAIATCGEPGGVLVSLGGDMAVAGEPPIGGWPILVAESPSGATGSPSQLVRLTAGGIATSSSLLRQWRNGARLRHHILDPRTGQPVDGPWRTATVGASTCAEANAASTAALVAGEGGVEWLAATGLPARLVGHDGLVTLVGGWPQFDGAPLSIPASRMSRYLAPAVVG